MAKREPEANCGEIRVIVERLETPAGEPAEEVRLPGCQGYVSGP